MSVDIQCESLTLKGERCKFKKKIGIAYCTRHEHSPISNKPAIKMTTICIGITKDKKPCLRATADPSGYCSSHSINTDKEYRDVKVKESYSCNGITKDMKQCMRTTTDPSGYCSSHSVEPKEKPKTQCKGIVDGIQCKELSFNILCSLCQSSKRHCKNNNCNNLTDNILCKSCTIIKLERERKAELEKELRRRYEATRPSIFIFNNIDYTNKLKSLSNKLQDEISAALRRYTLQSNVTPRNLRVMYLHLALKHHPDKGGNPETFKILGNDYDLLKDFIGT